MITEQKRYPMTWAKIEAVAKSATGFETITPQSARELLAERDAQRRALAEEEKCRHQAQVESRAATATLERVRALISPHYYEGTMIHATSLVKALAGQPEAPVRPNTGGGKCGQMFTSADDYPRPDMPPCPECAWPMGDVHSGDCKLMCRPEAPKGQELTNDQRPECFTISKRGGMERLKPAPGFDAEHSAQIRNRMAYEVHDFGTDKAIAVPVTQDQWDQGQRDLAAANARIAELEESNDCFERSSAQSLLDAKAANARADAAERDLTEWKAMHKRANEHRLEALTGRRLMMTERDQLAARVKELEERCQVFRANGACTLEERKVLEAMADYTVVILEDWNRDGTPRRKKLAKAELANRAAKAKQGDK